MPRRTYRCNKTIDIEERITALEHELELENIYIEYEHQEEHARIARDYFKKLPQEMQDNVVDVIQSSLENATGAKLDFLTRTMKVICDA